MFFQDFGVRPYFALHRVQDRPDVRLRSVFSARYNVSAYLVLPYTEKAAIRNDPSGEHPFLTASQRLEDLIVTCQVRSLYLDADSPVAPLTDNQKNMFNQASNALKLCRDFDLIDGQEIGLTPSFSTIYREFERAILGLTGELTGESGAAPECLNGATVGPSITVTSENQPSMDKINAEERGLERPRQRKGRYRHHDD